MAGNDRGLYDKFGVYDEAGESVDDCFVLRPGPSDWAAVAAINAYIRATNNDQLARDLREWLRELGVAMDTDEDKPGDARG